MLVITQEFHKTASEDYTKWHSEKKNIELEATANTQEFHNLQPSASELNLTSMASDSDQVSHGTGDP